MPTALIDPSAIPGWGIDADPQNDPAYPMRHLEAGQPRGLSWTRPAQQVPTVEILQSIEHNRQPAVVGTSTPPSGLSGMIRRVAFRRSESDWWHWLMLMGADRIDVVEAIVSDLAKGIVPNIPREMGIRAEWRHNRAGLVAKASVAIGVGAVVLTLMQSRNRSDAD
jgi:hypothetical protein